MVQYRILKLSDAPERKDQLALWFHQKWHIPLEAYQSSMHECLHSRSAVPQWYCAVAQGEIIAGLGVISNDFHHRKDLSPNVCAVYVEEKYRGQKIAGSMLNFVCKDMKDAGISTLYLVTDHTSFYERYGWEFLCMVQGDGEPHMSRMYMHKA